MQLIFGGAKAMFKTGTKIKITVLQKKDFFWPEGYFSDLSNQCNGQEARILFYHPEIKEFGERESYLVSVICKDGTHKEIEIEEDEFVLL